MNFPKLVVVVTGRRLTASQSQRQAIAVFELVELVACFKSIAVLGIDDLIIITKKNYGASLLGQRAGGRVAGGGGWAGGV